MLKVCGIKSLKSINFFIFHFRIYLKKRFLDTKVFQQQEVGKRRKKKKEEEGKDKKKID